MDEDETPTGDTFGRSRKVPSDTLGPERADRGLRTKAETVELRKRHDGTYPTRKPKHIDQSIV